MAESDESTSYEKKDLSLKVVIKLAIGTLAFLALIGVATKFVIGYEPKRYQLVDSVSRPQFPKYNVAKIFPEPRLQHSPRFDWEQYLAKQREALSSYAWVDEKAGLARIPIGIAMELYTQRAFDRKLQGKTEDNADHKGRKGEPYEHR